MTTTSKGRGKKSKAVRPARGRWRGNGRGKAPAGRRGSARRRRRRPVTVPMLIEELARGTPPRKVAKRHHLALREFRRRITSGYARKLIRVLKEMSQLQMEVMGARLGPDAVRRLMVLAEDATQKPEVRLRGCLGVIGAARDAARAVATRQEPGAGAAASEEGGSGQANVGAEPECDLERVMAKAAEIVLAEEEEERRARHAALRREAGTEAA